MKQKKGKLIFLVTLITILIAWFVGYFMFVDNKDVQLATDTNVSSVDTYADTLSYNNTHLSWIRCEIIDENVVYIDGDGSIEKEDLIYEIKSNGLQIEDLRCIIFGDSITEIGINCMTELDKLEAVKFGNSIKRVRMGGVKELS